MFPDRTKEHWELLQQMRSWCYRQRDEAVSCVHLLRYMVYGHSFLGFGYTETVWDQSGDEFSSRNRLLDQLQVLSGDFSATAQKPSGVEARQLEIMRGWPTMHVVGQIMSISLFFFPFLKTFRREGFTKKRG